MRKDPYPRNWNTRRPGIMPSGGRFPVFFDYTGLAGGASDGVPDGRLDVLIGARDNRPAYRTPMAIFRQDTVGGEPFFVLDESAAVVVDEADGPHPFVFCESSAMAELSGDGVLDLICTDSSRITKIWDVSQLPFGELRPLVGNDIYNRYPADTAIGDFNGDLLPDLMAPTYFGSDYGGNLVGVVDGCTLAVWFNDELTFPNSLAALAGANRDAVDPQVGIPGFGTCAP